MQAEQSRQYSEMVKRDLLGTVLHLIAEDFSNLLLETHLIGRRSLQKSDRRKIQNRVEQSNS